jgi:hypothetical protein
VVGIERVAEDLVVLLVPRVHGIEGEGDVAVERRRLRRRLDGLDVAEVFPTDVVTRDEVAREAPVLVQHPGAARVEDRAAAQDRADPPRRRVGEEDAVVRDVDVEPPGRRVAEGARAHRE